MAERLRGRAAVAQRKRRLEAEPLCRLCRVKGITSIATVPDHIQPLAKGGTDDDSNIRCLCAEHHDEVTRQEFGWKPKAPTIGLDGWPITPAGGV
jgi:5-methylcytosine-specific restriction protein A